MVDFFLGGVPYYIYINRRFCRCSCAHDDPHLLPFQSYRCLYLVHWLLHSPLFGVFCWCNFSFSFHVSFGQFGVGLVGEWVGARTSLHWRTLFDTTLKKNKLVLPHNNFFCTCTSTSWFMMPYTFLATVWGWTGVGWEMCWANTVVALAQPCDASSRLKNSLTFRLR